MTGVRYDDRNGRPLGSMPKRDYSLVGESTRRAVETGLASAEWYHTDVPRKTMKELMQRSDQPGDPRHR